VAGFKIMNEFYEIARKKKNTDVFASGQDIFQFIFYLLKYDENMLKSYKTIQYYSIAF